MSKISDYFQFDLIPALQLFSHLVSQLFEQTDLKESKTIPKVEMQTKIMSTAYTVDVRKLDNQNLNLSKKWTLGVQILDNSLAISPLDWTVLYIKL